ncbi:MAG: hypothetical protein DRJ98_06625 [Thermoprotei archaeon]|nr:MAG: hypothetical protein DRJ98_06625 [Thermoprotei archaeon]
MVTSAEGSGGYALEYLEIKAEPNKTKRIKVECGEYEVILEVKPKTTPKPLEGKLALVLDQTHKGYSQTLERYTPSGVEIHEIAGIGLTETVKVGERTYRHPAVDDYDVLRVIESLTKRFPVTIFVTGDKTLSEEAKLLRTAKGLNVEVRYMPPSDYMGKEAIIQAIIDTIKQILEA